eukprot:6468811-Amphidinium_carterae.2
MTWVLAERAALSDDSHIMQGLRAEVSWYKHSRSLLELTSAGESSTATGCSCTCLKRLGYHLTGQVPHCLKRTCSRTAVAGCFDSKSR